MKGTKLLILPALVLVGCGKFDKNPVSDIGEIRQKGKIATELGPDKPNVITKYVTVKETEVVTREGFIVDEKQFVITPDSPMSFNEAQTKTYKIVARSLLPNVKINIAAEGLPSDATLVRAEGNDSTYLLKWTPALYSVPANATMKTIPVKLTAQIVAANPVDAEKFKGLAIKREFNLFLFRNQEMPADLKVSGLTQEVSEGQLTSFSVTAKVPGSDQKTSQKPRLVVSYDGVSVSAGNDFQELDGSRYIIADSSKKEPEYVGDGVWKFALVFDTKNISVQPQLAKDGSVAKNADGTRVRLSFKIYSPNGLATPESLTQVKIKYARSLAAPRFDLSGLGAASLAVSPGENVDLKFIVEATDADAIKVVQKSSKLPGALNLSCQDSPEGSRKQNCQLTWQVPCDTNKEKLNGSVEMEAVSVIDGRESEKTTYKLKTTVATTDKNLCAGAK